jgi:hypothetical protein
MPDPFPNKIAAAIVGGAAGLQFVISFGYIALCLLGYDYLIGKGYSFFQIVTTYAILTALYRALRTISLIYSPSQDHQ